MWIWHRHCNSYFQYQHPVQQWWFLGTAGSRGRHNQAAAAAVGCCRKGPGTLNHSSPHLSRIRRVPCEAYFTSGAAQPGMKGDTQCHPTLAWARAGLDVSHCIQSCNKYWCNCKAPRIRIWMNSCLRDHSFRDTSPQCNKRRGKRWDGWKREKHGCWKAEQLLYLACLHLQTAYSDQDCYLKMPAMAISRK